VKVHCGAEDDAEASIVDESVVVYAVVAIEASVVAETSVVVAVSESDSVIAVVVSNVESSVVEAMRVMVSSTATEVSKLSVNELMIASELEVLIQGKVVAEEESSKVAEELSIVDVCVVCEVSKMIAVD
jgi:hypothetical protein